MLENKINSWIINQMKKEERDSSLDFSLDIFRDKKDSVPVIKQYV